MQLTKNQYEMLDSLYMSVWGTVWGNNPSSIGYRQTACDEAGIGFSMQNTFMCLAQDNRGSYYSNRKNLLKIEIIGE